MTRKQLREQLPELVNKSLSVQSMRIKKYYLDRYTAICDRLAELHAKEYPLKKRIAS